MSASALSVTTIAVLGGAGVLPGTGPSAPASPGADLEAAESSAETSEATSRDPAGPGAVAAEQAEQGERARAASAVPESEAGTARELPAAPSLPVDSGEGVRIVFSEGQQRVWLVDPGRSDADSDGVWRTYPVSGSTLDNLDPGTYEVFSRSRHAVGIDDSGTMEYFVRFTHGTQGAAIGFHTIPVDDGAPVQTRAQLGTPLSHGCIRQARADAVALWRTTPVGTTVVVTA